jgi:hypothetical protein
VVNIAVKTILAELKDNPRAPVLASSTNANDKPALTRYADALASDPVRRTRDIVATCRASGQRRAELQTVVTSGNKSNLWELRTLQLLRDCDTRWSSTKNMMTRLIYLYAICTDSYQYQIHANENPQPIQHFLLQPINSSHTHHLFDGDQWQVLHHIHHILEIPNLAQELLSAERTPTLSMALPAYEMLVISWTELKKAIPELSHYIDLGISKIMEYVSKGRRSRIYALAMSEFNNVFLSHNVNWYLQSSTQPRSSSGLRRIGPQRRVGKLGNGWKRR